MNEKETVIWIRSGRKVTNWKQLTCYLRQDELKKFLNPLHSQHRDVKVSYSSNQMGAIFIPAEDYDMYFGEENAASNNK